jgi:hypothetical protein
MKARDQRCARRTSNAGEMTTGSRETTTPPDCKSTVCRVSRPVRRPGRAIKRDAARDVVARSEFPFRKSEFVAPSLKCGVNTLYVTDVLI